MKKYVIIGGVAAGASAAARLRRLDETAEIIMLDKGMHVSFSNCSLPYRISETVDNDNKLVLMSKEEFNAKYNVDVRVQNEVITINEMNKEVTVKDLVSGNEYNESYDKLIIATGSEAIIPNFEGIDKIDYFVLKNVADTSELMNFIYEAEPKHMTVIGGGFIGLEVAENLRERGLEVTLIEGSNQVMQPLDFEIASNVNRILRENGIGLITNKLVSSFGEKNVILNDGTSISTDGVVLAIGVKPATNFLKETSIELSSSGHIITNENYVTSNDDIYAGGDAILVKNSLTQELQPLPLAGPANKQGRLIADHINGKRVLNKGYIGSSVIKIFDYTFASTGLNEKQILAMKTPYDYEVAYVSSSDKVSLMPNSNSINLKLIFEKETGLVLGAQGYSLGNVDKRIDVIATTIKFSGTVYDLADLELVYAPHNGTGKDVVNKVGYQATNLLDGTFKQVIFTEINGLVSNGDVQIIDVRGPQMYNQGHIKGAINIPVPMVRSNLNKLDKSKTVYVNCQIGYNSYNVVMLLSNLGYDAVNIAGGFSWLSNYENEMCVLDNNRSVTIEK